MFPSTGERSDFYVVWTGRKWVWWMYMDTSNVSMEDKPNKKKTKTKYHGIQRIEFIHIKNE